MGARVPLDVPDFGLRDDVGTAILTPKLGGHQLAARTMRTKFAPARAVVNGKRPPERGSLGGGGGRTASLP